MNKKIEQRGKFTVNIYDVEITADMRNKCLRFAKEIILSDNQYSRLLPSEIKNSGNVSMQQKIEVQRTYLGKLGELVFFEFLNNLKKEIDSTKMFNVYPGQNNVDGYDFVTKKGNTVDVKTGFRDNHKRLLINCEQFVRSHKHYYVAVKLNARDIHSELTLVDWDDITSGTVIGYAEYTYLKKYAKTKYFGEGNAKYIEYNRLLGIDRLLKEF